MDADLWQERDANPALLQSAQLLLISSWLIASLPAWCAKQLGPHSEDNHPALQPWQPQPTAQH